MAVPLVSVFSYSSCITQIPIHIPIYVPKIHLVPKYLFSCVRSLNLYREYFNFQFNLAFL